MPDTSRPPHRPTPVATPTPARAPIDRLIEALAEAAVADYLAESARDRPALPAPARVA